jgi:LPS-assembly protein
VAASRQTGISAFVGRWRRIAAALALLAGIMPAHAQQVDRSQPVLLDADTLTYDENLGVVTASGDVELTQGDRVLRADSVSYNQRANKVSASGNVTLLEPTGEVLFAEYAELIDDMREGFLRGLRMLLADDSRFAAVNARRRGGVETQLSKAVYSPCVTCVDEDGEPVWQLKAGRITHNSETREIVYRDARLEALGVPVLYTPYFSHPDPSVKRKSGFLAPTFGATGALGSSFQMPYFWAIDDSRDFTFDPILSTEVIAVVTGEYREAFSNGELRARASATRDDAQTGRNRFRGHIDSEARFSGSDIWRWGADIKAVTDDTYLARYRFPYTNTLTSQLFAEGFTQRKYARADIQHLQGLRSQDEQDRIPIIAPNLNYNYVGEPNSLGAFMTFDANALALTRTAEGVTDMRRMSLETGWELPHIGSLGDVTTFRLTLQTDVYNVANVPGQGASGGSTLSGTTGRVFPKLSVNWRYPWVRNSGDSSQVVEPIVSFVTAPNGSNPTRIPNEDSLAFEFDETNLFDRTRFVGSDRVDGGTWVAYGFRVGAYGIHGGSATALFGQSYRLRDDDTYPRNAGLDDNFSDYVGRVLVSPSKYLDVIYKARLDKDNFQFRRMELGAGIGPRAFRVAANYIFFDQTGEFPDREELSFGASSVLTDSWSISANTRRDLTSGGGTLSYGGSVTYTCDCLIATLSYDRSFTRDRDVAPTTAVFLRLTLKSLGQFQSSLF